MIAELVVHPLGGFVYRGPPLRAPAALGLRLQQKQPVQVRGENRVGVGEGAVAEHRGDLDARSP